MHDKPTLRQHMRERLRTLDDTTRKAASAQIAAHLLHHLESRPGKLTLALFGGLKNEPNLLPHLLPALKAQGACACFF